MPGKVKQCRICGSAELRPVLDLGAIPPVDTFLKQEELGGEEKFPLKVIICEGCSLVQLEYVVPKEKLFHEEYAYDMSVTDSGVEHFHNMAEVLGRRYRDCSSVLDIGSNTGVLLEGFQELGWEVLGVEPSENVYSKAIDKGVPTENSFFSEEVAVEMADTHGRFDLVTATNVFAHIEDLNGAVTGVKKVLEGDGVLVIETPYLKDLVEMNEFDTIYHEHLSYFSLKPLKRLLERNGMEIIDIEGRQIHGGSLRVHAARKGEREKTGAVSQYLDMERNEKLHSEEVLEAFSERVRSNINSLEDLVSQIDEEGGTVAGLGAPAKGVVLLNCCGLDSEKIPYVSEKSPLKIGRFVPGTHNEVISDEELLERDPDYLLILPWNFADSLMQKFQRYAESGGKFILPVPEPHVVDEL